MAAAGGSPKFEAGGIAILFNGSLCYEAEIVQVQSADAAPPKKGAKKGSGEGTAYLIRYTKWPRRPEEWVGDSFVYPWSEQLSKSATNRPPRKLMWVEHKAASGSAAAAAAASVGDDDAVKDEEGGEAASGPRRGGRATKPAAAGADADEAGAGKKRQRKPAAKDKDEGAGGARGRSTTPLSEHDDGSAAAAAMAAMDGQSDADALLGLMGGGPSDRMARHEEEGEEDEGEEDEEEDEGEDDEEEDDDDESNDGEEEDEEMDEKEERDEEEEGEDEDDGDAADDLKLLLAQKKHKEKESGQAPELDSPMLKSPRADKKAVDLKHRRKGIPLKSLKPLTLMTVALDVSTKGSDAGDADGAQGEEGSGGMGTRSANAPAPAQEESGVVSRLPGAVRRRKPKCPARSLI